MTQKDIIAIAKNPVAMEILAEIAHIQETRRMKELAKELIEEIERTRRIKELAKALIEDIERNEGEAYKKEGKVK